MPKEAPLNGDAPTVDDNIGDVPVGPRRRVSEMQAKLHRWAVADPGRRFDDLFNLVHDPATLIVAWDRVATNRGAKTAGSDGLIVTRIETDVGVAVFLDDLREQIKSGEFRPEPVRERKIPKPGGSGKVRRLGIPTVTDRVVQAALKLVLEPIFEADFEPVSYGFRPERRAHDAIAEIHLFGTKGYQWVLDADIEACFDSIDHAALMERVRLRVKDEEGLMTLATIVTTRSATWPPSSATSRPRSSQRARAAQSSRAGRGPAAPCRDGRLGNRSRTELTRLAAPGRPGPRFGRRGPSTPGQPSQGRPPRQRRRSPRSPQGTREPRRRAR